MCLADVAGMTMDQMIMMLVDRKQLRNREKHMESVEAVSMASRDGKIKGRARDGTSITGVILGKSVARQLMEKAAAARVSVVNPPRMGRRR